MRRTLTAEFTGTFLLVLCGTGAIVVGQTTLGALAAVGLHRVLHPDPA